MPAPDSIRALCETFRLHREHYTSGGYNETELRREFLDPFFTALGWDVDNKAGYADAYKARRFHATESHINNLVIGLYGLGE